LCEGDAHTRNRRGHRGLPRSAQVSRRRLPSAYRPPDSPSSLLLSLIPQGALLPIDLANDPEVHEQRKALAFVNYQRAI
jgi:hypothetical protein